MNKPPLQFKDSLPNLTIIELHTQHIDDLTTAIRQTIKQAPMMFIGMQVVLDCNALRSEEFNLPIVDLKNFLTGEGLNLIAIMSDNQEHRQKAVDQGIGALPVVAQLGGKKRRQNISATNTDNVGVEEAAAPTEPTVKEEAQTKRKHHEPRKLGDDESTNRPVAFENQVINHSVRSGQRVYSRGDLVIVGSVSAGAEVIAEGNIHIYGSLRGRAIAGARGDENARIFCQRLEAELISIAGNYKPNEDISEEFCNKSVQISLEDEKICFLTL